MMKYRQLSESNSLAENQIAQIGTLIHDTDPYIFPCVCSTEDAELLGKLCVTGEDTIFSFRNCFVAEENGEIFGLILWHLGPVCWDPVPLQKLAEAENRTLSPLLSLAQKEYFAEYQAVAPDMISVMNVCVDASNRGRGIGTRMLEAFLSEHPGKPMELFVLAENSTAIALYSKLGFVIETDDLPAFTPDHNYTIRSKKMIRL